MDFNGLQMALIVAVVLTAATWVVFFDYRKKQRQQQQTQRIRTRSAARPLRPIKVLDITPHEYVVANKLAAERPLEPLVATANASRPYVAARVANVPAAAPSAPPAPRRSEEPLVGIATPAPTASRHSEEPLVGIATASRPPVEPRIERDTVTVQMASPSPGAPSFPTDVQLPAFTIDAALWERLIASQPKHNLISSADGDPEPIEETPAPPTLGSVNTVDATFHVVQSAHRDELPEVTQCPLPSGMIQQPALQKLLESEELFTGLIVSIGVNDSDSSMWHSQGLMQSVGNCVAGLLREKDFSCRTAYDEFIMVCSGEEGPQSQRRLNHISERLWDYQLRGIGACSILFSWGGVQVQDQPLAEAIASATERMRQTKRSGNSAQSALAHRQAV